MIRSLLINLLFWLNDTLFFLRDIFAIVFGEVRYG